MSKHLAQEGKTCDANYFKIMDSSTDVEHLQW